MTIKPEAGKIVTARNGSTQHDDGYALGVSIPQLAVRTGLSEFLLYAQANAGQLPGCRRIGRRFLVHVPTFEKWLADGWGEEV